ncbi:PepSY domain-containing protein [Rhodobacter maris]|uniref:YpeB-like protein with putative protease inhibitory function n=1 Tax=Rhodobacter maris TaxID=446682 RepID=A0A285T217_9RHOB|nr:PepSY domain-containing protein [Rhodobacter maris]SOC15367.1 YpeB-like protein with putative protease inhibitory function [Rhodobacter maris]
MKKTLLATALILSPVAALAMPAVGDVVGTNPTDVSAALGAKGCTVSDFEAEDGKVEAVCSDEAKMVWEVVIDPASGAVTEIKEKD